MEKNNATSNRWFHFGCGLLLGITLFAFTVIKPFLRDQVSYLVLGLILLAVLIIALSARKYGNAFWEWIGRTQ